MSSYLVTLITSEESNESEVDETEDNIDPLMFCSPRYLVFNKGTYEQLMVKDLLGIVKVMV